MKYIKNEKSNWSLIKTCIIFLLIVFVVFITARYITEEDFRNEFDTYILRKDLTNSNLNTVELNSDVNPNVFAYNKYICVLSKNSLTEYSSDASVSGKLDVNISVPLIDTNDKYLVLAETNGQKLYLILDSNIVWQTSLEGKISKVSVNKNGYVSVILTNTTYKSVIAVFSPDGTELFRKYLSTNYAICSDISNSNKYLAIGEVNYTGTIIESYVEIIFIALAQTDSENSILNTYESENGEIITNIKYQSQDVAVCMFNTYIQKVTQDKNERMCDITKDNLFLDINLNDNIAVISKQSSGLFSYEYDLSIKSVSNKSESLYILNSSVPKATIISETLIGLNFGDEVQIVNLNGWLMKKYTSNKEIKNVVIGNNVVGIVYKDKIEIVNI